VKYSLLLSLVSLKQYSITSLY